MLMPTQHEEHALKHAARCAVAAGALPWTFRRMVDRIETASEPYRRAAHVVERRNIELALSPGHGTRNMDVAPLPSGRGRDPWSVDPRVLADETTTTSVCPSCVGSKKVTCSDCGGVSRVGCDGCGGSGLVQGQRGAKNCPTCRGQGTRSCKACRNGLVQCDGCEGLGRVKAWLELRSRQFVQVLAHPTSGVAMLHQGLLSGDDFDRPAADHRNALVADSGWCQAAPPGLEPQLRATVDPVADRVVRCRVQDFASSVVRIQYRTRTSSGLVAVAGRPLGTLPETTWTPLHRRALLSLAAGAITLVSSMMVVGSYDDRAPWFAEYGNAGLLAWLGLLAAVLSMLTVAGLMLPRSARASPLAAAPAGLLASTCAMMLVSWFETTPSLEGVEGSLERGDLWAARLEAEAVVAEDGASAGSSAALEHIATLEAEAERLRMEADDQRHLDRVRQSSSVREAARALAEPWCFDENREAALALLRERAVNEIDGAYATANVTGLKAVAEAMAAHDAQLAMRAHARVSLLEAEALRGGGELAAAVQALVEWEAPPGDLQASELHAVVVEHTATDLLARLRAPLDADAAPRAEQAELLVRIEHASLFEKLTGKRPPFDVAAAKKRLAAVERELASEARRAERDRKRAQAREQRLAQAEERKRARAAQSEAPPRPRARPTPREDNRVQCCDGSKSPTCTYDRGSLRGCCSHHGGVC
jgi:hypothetical protein